MRSTLLLACALVACVPIGCAPDAADIEPAAASEVSASPSPHGAGGTFAETLNPTGDPIGGGPGYTGAYRTALGLSGPAICTEGEATHVVTTEAQLQARARTYTRRSDGATVSGSSPATAGQIVFLKGDGSGELALSTGLNYDFNSGVTVCGNLGLDNGDGTYEWGALVTVAESWPKTGALDFQEDAVFQMTRGWRLSGIRLEGPSTWGLQHNVNLTWNWAGEALGIRTNTTSYAERPEIDNVWLDGWSYMGINLYKGHALAHHFRILHARREGYGYGVYPGRVIEHGNPTLTEQAVVGWQIHETRHATDGVSIGVSETCQTADYNEVVWRSGIVSGHNRYTLLNTHGRAKANADACNGYRGEGYGSYRLFYERIATFSDAASRTAAGILNAGNPTGPPDGILRVNHIWSMKPSPLDFLRVGGDTFAQILAGTATLPRVGGDRLDIDFETIYGGGVGIVRPAMACALDDDTVTEGGAVTLTLSATDPDGHPMRWYEVRWGDGTDVRASTGRYFVGDAPTHTYAAPGVYVIRVDGFNAFGVFGTQTLPVYVAPSDLSTPKWTFRVAPSIPPDFGGFPGHYEGRVLINGVEVYAMDLLDAASYGWQDVEVDAAASLAGATTFHLAVEIEVLRNVPAPQAASGSGTDPGVASMRLDNLWLWGDDGLRAREAAWERMDPLFDASRSRHGVEYDWNAQGGARVVGYDTPSDDGGILQFGTRATTAQTVGKYNLRTRDYLHVPHSAVGANAGGDFTITWDAQNIAEGVQIEYGPTPAYGTVITTADDGSHTITGRTGLYWRIRAYAPRWDDRAVTVYSAYTSGSP